MHHRRIAGLTGARTTLVITRPIRAPHRTIPEVGLIGGRLGKNVARLSSEQAGSPEPVHRHTEGLLTNRLMLRRCGEADVGALNLRLQEHLNPGVEVQPRRRHASHPRSGGTRRSRAAVIQAAAVGPFHTPPAGGAA
jgi:hypothetical protein